LNCFNAFEKASTKAGSTRALRGDVQAVDLRMSEIDSVYSRSLGEGLWRLDARQLQLQVEGIIRLPDIRYVELREVTDRAGSSRGNRGLP
jgi:hypothetical protein